MHRALVIAWSMLAGCVFAAEPAFDTLIAHRGESVDAPENTLPAYRMAVERGFGFECDVYLSSDGRVFTFHDSTLTRTTGGAFTRLTREPDWGKRVTIQIVCDAGYVNPRRLEGTVKAVRVYSRMLTEDELRWNRLVDEQRFFGDPGTVFFMR